MSIHFSKYHGTGNDFILIDDRDGKFDVDDTSLINQMCSRRFGIGADGLILLRRMDGYDFSMVYFNSDGNQGSMCGNGGRCIVQFAHSLGLFEQKCIFIAVDGQHEAIIQNGGDIKLKMNDVSDIKRDGDAHVLDTGSPHYVLEVEDVDNIDIKNEGSRIRYSASYTQEGINVNFIQRLENGIKVVTYERGVEDETYSCGTGVTASAIAISEMEPESYQSPVPIQTKGGRLLVFFTKNDKNEYSDIWLQGPAVKSFEGSWNIAV